MSSVTDLVCQPAGERALFLECVGPLSLAKQRRLWQLADRLQAQPAIENAVPGMNNLTVLLHPNGQPPEAYIAEVLDAWQGTDSTLENRRPRTLDIPVRYGGNDGPDLSAVAEHTGLSPAQVIERHANAVYTVYFLGFVPGFAYLGGLDPLLETPRLAEPRLAVPAGSVAIGGMQTGVYPLSTPGGWRIIGRTDTVLFDAQGTPPTLLRPGDEVRFIPDHTCA